MFSRHRGHTFVAPPTDDSITISIASNTFDFNLLAYLGAALAGPTTVTIRVETGVIVQALSTGTPAMDLQNVMFAGSTLRLLNFGYIQGMGGRGGKGSSMLDQGAGLGGGENHAAEDGRAGGNAISGPGTGITFEITNGAGRIRAGGGGGGGGGASVPINAGTRIANGGGGGGGAGGGEAGYGGKAVNVDAGDGTDGSTGVNGAAGTGGAGANSGADGANGGAGGDWGVAGSNGASPASLGSTLNPGTGGAAGKAVELNGGTASFLSGGGSPNVRGAVS
jgi:hypothetical protein